MAASRCVGLQCDIKDIFDKALKPAVFKQMKQTIQTHVDKKKSKGLIFDDKCKDGWLLKVTVVSLKVNDANKPTTIEVKVSIGGVPLYGTANGFKASGSSKASGINNKKMEQEATFIVDNALEKLMTKQAIPHMLKA